ncbi:MAG: hypothetical protein WBD84_10190 [Methyloceanibacter sp.]
MAQEQAKSPPVGEAADKASASLDAKEMSTGGEVRDEAQLEPDVDADGQRKLSLAERLRAEQRKISERKTPEPRMEDAKPADLDDIGAAGGRPITRSRRGAGGTPRRIAAAAAANDDLPSIGGLIFALQQRPSKSPFLLAFVASLVWFVVGGFLAYGLVSSGSQAGGTADLLANPSTLTAAVAILVPIAIFWFLALLVWRAQELRLMASAMTEVAVRLAEPDKLAEQSVASLGQTIRRQVAAMNDAISRAIGRAGELEALVHNEVAALERSYSDNELRVRGLISELASEREALTNNSERVSESLKGVGAQIARDLSTASSNIDKRLAERGVQLTELLVARSSEAAEQVHRAQTKVQEHMPLLLERLGQEQERLGQVVEGASKNLSALESAVGERTTALDHTLRERTEALTTTLETRIQALESTVSHGAVLLDNTLKDRTEAFATSIGQGAAGLDSLLKERAKLLTASISEESNTLDKTLRDRTEAFANFIGQGATGLDKLLKDRTEAFAISIGQGATGLDKLLTDRTAAFATSIGQGAVGLDNVLKERTKLLTASISEESAALDKTLKDRAETLATSVEQSVSGLGRMMAERTEQVAAFIGQGSAVLDQTLKDRTELLATSLGEGASALDRTLKERAEQLTTSLDQGTSALDKTLKDHGENFHLAISHQATALAQSLKERTDAFASAINLGAIALDRTLADRSEAFTSSLAQRSKAVELAIGQQASALDKSLAERTLAVTNSLTERLQTIDTTFGQRTSEIDRVLAEHSRTVEVTFGKQATQLHELLASNSAMIRQTAGEVGSQSKEAIGALTAQTQTLRQVSSGLLEQIHSLTQRFENQGQAILTAAKALDSSNTKIDSILENRHQAIIGLLHAVNTKGQDLDGAMRSYAGTIENALTHAETRAKQIGGALARDTAGQAQQALSQIERLREEAQAHTARAVGDLKSSFETVITQIGRQLEQMRGQFDNTSQGMRDAAQKTATDLDSIRQEMQRRMESLPQQTAQATAAIRKALADQLKEIEAITPVLTRPQLADQNAEPYRQPQLQGNGRPQLQGSGAEPYRQPQLPPRMEPLVLRNEENGPAADYDAPPPPQFDARGRPAAAAPLAGSDLGSVANSLAQQLSGASHLDRRSVARPQGQPAQYPNQVEQRQVEPRQPDRRREAWSVNDLLANAETSPQPQRPDPYAPRAPQPRPAGPAQGLRLDEIARAMDHRTAAEVWQRFRAGEQGILGRHLYSLDGQATFDEISRRYERDGDFRATVDRYIGDFERLLNEAEQNDPDGRMLQNYMTSETGRVYLLLAHASGRLR